MGERCVQINVIAHSITFSPTFNSQLGIFTGPDATTPVRAKSAVSYDNSVYFRDPSHNIVGIQPTPSAENSTWNTLFHVGWGRGSPARDQNCLDHVLSDLGHAVGGARLLSD